MTTTVQLPRGATQSRRPTTLPRANSPADIEMMVLELRDGDIEMTVARGELDGAIEMENGDDNEDVEMGDWVRNTENVDADVAEEEPTGEDVEMVDGDRTDDVEIENA